MITEKEDILIRDTDTKVTSDLADLATVKQTLMRDMMTEIINVHHGKYGYTRESIEEFRNAATNILNAYDLTTTKLHINMRNLLDECLDRLRLDYAAAKEQQRVLELREKKRQQEAAALSHDGQGV